MATLKAVVRTQRADGYYPVYIRITHHRSSVFLKTDKVVTKKYLSKDRTIKDPFVNQYCSQKIVEYMDRLNRVNTENWTARDIADYLTTGTEDISFSQYARKYISGLVNMNRERTAKNYSLALRSLEEFTGLDNIMFSHMTSHIVKMWIDSLEQTHRAKEMYPICMRQVFKAAILEYNDYDTGMIRIKTNPWIKVKIPEADRTEKRAITPEACRTFFSFPIPESRMKIPLTELGRDVAMMVLCLAGINTIDLYQMQKENYYGGVLHYHRAKTMRSRTDGAYFEMRVPPILLPVFEKYMDRTEDSHLFNFHRRMSTADSFNANVNAGLRQMCKAMGIPKENHYSAYTFRHTWATVAQNDIKATIAEVAFAMNHSTNKVTRGYIKIDYTPAWELNEKVVDFIFFSDQASVQEQEEEEPGRFRLCSRYMVEASAYFSGQKLASFTDVGFNNVDEVIARLVSELPKDIPDRSIVMFKITNIDKDQTVVYQKQKGKGF